MANDDYQGISSAPQLLTHPAEELHVPGLDRKLVAGHAGGGPEQTQRVDDGRAPSRADSCGSSATASSTAPSSARRPALDRSAQRLDTLVATTRADGGAYAMVIHPEYRSNPRCASESFILRAETADYDWSSRMLAPSVGRPSRRAGDHFCRDPGQGAAGRCVQAAGPALRRGGERGRAEVLAEELPQRVPGVFSGRAPRSGTLSVAGGRPSARREGNQAAARTRPLRSAKPGSSVRSPCSS